MLGYGGQTRSWEAAPRESKADRLELTATNVSSVTIDPRRAHVTCATQLAVRTDGPLAVTLAGCGRAQTFQP